MNKSNLVDRVADHLGVSKAQASRCVEAVIEAIAEGVREDDRVAIAGFGAFTKRHRAARVVVNPTTRQPVEIKAGTTCAFRPAPALKNALDNGHAPDANPANPGPDQLDG